MAPTFRHGRGTEVFFNGVDMSLILNDATWNGNASPVDVTAFKATDRAFIAGIRSADGSFAGMSDSSTDQVDELFRQALGASAAAVITVIPGGAALGDVAFLGSGRVSQRSQSSPVDGVVAVTAGVEYTGESRDGLVVAASQTYATPTTHATQSLGSTSSTGGAVAHIHILSATTSGTTAVELAGAFQDSSDAVTWADHIAIASVSSTAPIGSQRLLSTGLLNENVRFRAATQGSTAINYIAAIGRR
jgi:hypothetical protein